MRFLVLPLFSPSWNSRQKSLREDYRSKDAATATTIAKCIHRSHTVHIRGTERSSNEISREFQRSRSLPNSTQPLWQYLLSFSVLKFRVACRVYGVKKKQRGNWKSLLDRLECIIVRLYAEGNRLVIKFNVSIKCLRITLARNLLSKRHIWDLISRKNIRCII